MDGWRARDPDTIRAGARLELDELGCALRRPSAPAYALAASGGREQRQCCEVGRNGGGHISSVDRP